MAKSRKGDRSSRNEQGTCHKCGERVSKSKLRRGVCDECRDERSKGW